MDNKNSQLKEYIETTHEIRKLASPSVDFIDYAKQYRKILYENFIIIGQLAKTNNKILNSYLYKLLDDNHILTDEERKDLWDFSNDLQDARSMETINEVLRHRVIQKLFNDADARNDKRSIILALDAMIETNFALMHMAARVLPSEEHAFYYRDLGLKAADRLLEYLAEEEFINLPDEECKHIVLVNSRYVSALFERSDNFSAEINKHDFDLMKKALALKDNPFYLKHAPNYNWKYHEFRTLQYITNFTEISNIRGFNQEELKEIQEYTLRLKDLVLNDLDYFEKYCTKEMVNLYLYRVDCLCGDISKDEYMDRLFEIIDNSREKNFDLHENITFLLSFAEYLRTVDKEELDLKNKERLSLMYIDIVHYLHNAPKSGSFLFLLSFLAAILKDYVDCGSREREFEHFCLELMVAIHPPTYVHSLGVASISENIAKNLLKYQPERFIGFLGCKNIEDVNNKKDEILDFVYHSALCHDIGKLFVADTIITYERDLLAEDYDFIKAHASIGSYILEQHKETKDYANIAKYHHVSYDGKNGYPDEDINNLNEKVIIDIARIADCMDAATDSVGRAYKKGLIIEQYYKELQEGYDSNYAGYIIDMLEIPEVKEETEELLKKDRNDNYLKAFKILKRND